VYTSFQSGKDGRGTFGMRDENKNQGFIARRDSLDAGAASAARSHVSLEGVHGSIDVPHPEAGFWQQWRAFVGPAILVSVGYMDPGNWGTDLQGGAQF
jgi:hypothetical protein